MVKILHIRIGGLQLSHKNAFQESYFSLNFNDKYYFSSTFDNENIKLQDDILIELNATVIPENIILQRWENCMIIFNLNIQIAELRNRNFSKKKIQTKWHQFLNIQFQIYEDKDVIFSNKYMQNVSQHYLIIQDVFFTSDKYNARKANQPNYFTINTKNSSFLLPIRQAVVLVKLPDSIQIKSFVNNVFNGTTGIIKHQKLVNGEEININKDMSSQGKIKLRIKWAVNLHRYQVDQNFLLQSNELMIYDLELKFDNPGDVVGCKFKANHGSKAFDFAQDIDKSKITKVKKVVFFIIKSETEEVNFVLTRNGKVFTYCRFNTSEIGTNQVTIIKKKWPDMMNPTKFYGYIKFRAERGRNLSIPQSNKYWRDVLRRKHVTNMMVSVHQASIYSSDRQNMSLVAKIQNDEKMVNTLNNINFYDGQDQPNQNVVQFAIKGEESLYLIVKSDVKSNDFVGIGVVNTTQLKLGTNPCQVPYFKNQEKAGILNCLINKMVFWPFLKPVYQTQAPLQQQQSLCIDIFFNNIIFSPYFYTYRYDGKEEVYCIVQVNRIKKVLILENTAHDKLSFFAAAGSDALNFSVEQPDVIKIKVSFLVSDLGHEEQIYGTATCKIKGSDIYKQPKKMKNIEILNDYSVGLGSFSIEASKGIAAKGSPKNKTADNEKPSGGSFDLSQASFDTNLVNRKSSNPSRRYSGGYINNKNSKPALHYLKKNTHSSHKYQVKLPVIKEKKDKDNFNDLLQMMKVRKRQVGGGFEEKGMGSPRLDRSERHQRNSFDLQKLQKSNPNIDRNLQILFPRKGNESFIKNNRTKQNDYDERLKGLKSVMNEISDIGQVEPTIRESRHEEHAYENEQFYEPEPEWEGNQFAQ